MSLAVDSALENPATLLAGLGSLAALLAVAVVYDRRAGHVPGVLCYCGALLGILLHTLLPDGLGFRQLVRAARSQHNQNSNGHIRHSIRHDFVIRYGIQSEST